MKTLSDFDVAGLAALFAEWGHNPAHAGRLLREYYGTGGCVDLDALKIGKQLAERLQKEFVITPAALRARHVSADGTVKLLLDMGGGAVEAVLMSTPYSDRAAGCVSSQIGCAMGCDFCASTKDGLQRNLASGEIVDQFLHLRQEALLSGRRLATLVFMGMGEPLQNLDNVIAAIRRIGGEELGALGWRQISVSTVGLVPGMDRLAESGLNVNLALSLHAPDDETRARIVPMNKRYDVAAIMAAAKRFHDKTRRIVNIEYCLLGGVNDSDEHARKLAELMSGFRAHVNLIPYNAIGPGLSGVEHHQPSAGRVGRFLEILRAARVVAHPRQRRGDDVNAACGQLARKKEAKE
jgi:23S rRNA (adenine2503-C2)-methyltransferase